jgi:hypothetical protein
VTGRVATRRTAPEVDLWYDDGRERVSLLSDGRRR